MASEPNVTMEGTAEGVNNEDNNGNYLDLLVVSQILTHPPPPKRSKPNEEKASVLPNFGKLRSETYKLYKWDDDEKWKCRICG